MDNGSADDLVYFLHIPKTSGVSLHDFLLQVGGPDATSPPLLWDHLISGKYELTTTTRYLIGHFGGLLPLWLKRWPRIITMLREPRARALSHINHVQRDAAHPLHRYAAGLSIAQYCAQPQLRETIDNLQSRYLASLCFSEALVPRAAGCPEDQIWGSWSIRFEDALHALDRETGLRDEAMHALDRLDAVGICELHGLSLQLFARMFSWHGEATEAFLNTAHQGQRTVADLTPGELEALDRLNEIDTQVYRHALRRFQALCQSHGMTVDSDLLDRLAGSQPWLRRRAG